jgi:Radical SAM superfamily/Iron-sulfur cluster-binding domain
MRIENLVPTERSWKAKYIKPPLMKLAAMLGEGFLYYRLYPPLSRQARNRYAGMESRILPHTVSLETRSICNGRCEFCASSVQNNKRPDKTMPREVFDSVVDELASVGYQGRLALFVNNEPLLDKRLPELISSAREKLPEAFVQVSTNGIKLNAEIAADLLDRGLNDLTVNDYTSTGFLADRVRETAKALPETYADRFFVHLRKVDEHLYNRAGSAPNAGPLAQPIPAFCSFPFVQMNIIHDGTVSLCCQDLLTQSPMGNVMENGVLGVWFGEAFRKARADLLKMDRTQNPVCKICDYRGFKLLTGNLAWLNSLFTVLK